MSPPTERKIAPSISVLRDRTVVDTTKLALMLEIAERAIIADTFQNTLRAEEALLSDAYARWKMSHGFSSVQRDTPEWSNMMAATGEQYRLTEIARKDERNARRRLQTSISRYRKVLGASSSDLCLGLAPTA